MTDARRRVGGGGHCQPYSQPEVMLIVASIPGFSYQFPRAESVSVLCRDMLGSIK